MKKKLIDEAILMIQLRSPFLVKIYGICESKLVMELMPLGSLYKMIESKVLLQPIHIRIQIMIDVIKGLEYLHNKSIIHGDIKSLNILLAEEGGSIIAKISDFGLSKIYTNVLNNTVPIESNGLSLKWAAPELLQEIQIVTPAVDIYAYGTVLWELITFKKPYEGLSYGAIIRKVISGEREEIPFNTSPIIENLIQGCWSEYPESRPKPDGIHQELITLMNSSINKSFNDDSSINQFNIKINHQSTDILSNGIPSNNVNNFNNNINGNNTSGIQYRQQHNTIDLC